MKCLDTVNASSVALYDTGKRYLVARSVSEASSIEGCCGPEIVEVLEAFVCGTYSDVFC